MTKFDSLGVTVADGGVDVAVYSRHATQIYFCLFDEPGEKELQRVKLVRRDDDVHKGFIAGVTENARYGLRADGPWQPERGHLFDVNKLLVDPYARQIDRPFRYGAEQVPKGIVRKVPPAAASLERRPEIIYEIPVKAFTMRHPLVPAGLRGTVAALGHPAIIDYLKELGVDTVELMPLMAWIDERHLPPLGLSNAWGYNPVTFMAPDPRLAPGGYAEIRAAVAALHAAGIGVILDAVLNHTGETDREGPTLSLRGLDNATYYRHRDDNPGVLVNDTGCGNTIAADRPPVARLLLDALRCWAEETGLDGFRFDLATVLGRSAGGFSHDAAFFAMIEGDSVLSRLTMIAEPWDVGPGGYQLGSFPAGWREWNDRFRDDVRRYWRGDSGSLGAFATRLAGSSDIFQRSGRFASSSINYVAAHDGFTLRDLVTYSTKHNEANGEGNRDGTNENFSWEAGTADERQGDIRALMASLFVSRGTPMLTAGDEFGRTQSGNNNAYAQDNETTWLNWDDADQNLMSFTCKLFALRKEHPCLTGDRFLSGTATEGDGIPDVRWLAADGGDMTPEKWNDRHSSAFGMTLYDADDRCCVWFNNGREASTGWLPPVRGDYQWKLALASSQDFHRDELSVFALPARSVLIFTEAESSTTRRRADDALVANLAEAAGIHPVWWTIDGTEHRVTPEVQRTLLAAMGMSAVSGAEARDSIEALRRQVPQATATSAHCFLPEEVARGEKVFGIMAHLYALRSSLPSAVGDFGTLREFCVAAAREGAHAAGINPLHHLFPGNRKRVSPYQPSDRRFIDPIYIDLRSLARDVPALAAKLDSHSTRIEALSRLTYIDYPAAWDISSEILRTAFDAFESIKPNTAWRAFMTFCTEHGEALESHALYEALGSQAGSLAPRSKQAIAFAAKNQSEIVYQKWLQWVADGQIADAVSGHREIVYRDLAVGTALDGGEVWADPELFASNVSMGAPPDPFSAKGQVWGLAPFRPHVLLERGLEPYADILRRNLRHAGWLRIDHALGLARQFWVPSGGEGKDGAYVTYPLIPLIEMIARESRNAECAIIAEDLGTVPKGLREKLAAARMFSYKVLWFEREGAVFRPPEGYPYLSASCLGSHDLPTLRARARGDHLRLDRKLGRDSSDTDHAAEVHALRRLLETRGIAPRQGEDEADVAVHELLARSGSALALLQADDLFGELEPLNVPGTDTEYPNWRRRLSQEIGDVGRTPLSWSILERIRALRSGRGER